LRTGPSRNDTGRDAIAREKQLKGWVRARKVRLIEQKNPTWKDVADTWFAAP